MIKKIAVLLAAILLLCLLLWAVNRAADHGFTNKPSATGNGEPPSTANDSTETPAYTKDVDEGAEDPLMSLTQGNVV